MGAYFDSFALKCNPGGINALSKGTAKASDPDYSKAIDKIEQTIKAGVFENDSVSTDFDTASALFEEGKAAMILDGSWYTGEAFAKLKGDGGVMLSYPTADPGQESKNQYAMAGGSDTDGVAIYANTKDKDLAANIASMFAYYREVAEYQQQHLITAPIRTTDLKFDKPLDPVSQRLLSVIPKLTYQSQFIHNLPNTEFATTLTEELQKLIVGESKRDFIKNVDKSIESTTK
jgi:raffinose/stachyose/melibiose transport system substrate-binding protein